MVTNEETGESVLISSLILVWFNVTSRNISAKLIYAAAEIDTEYL